MGRFINPFTDYGFKKIFGQEISKDLLIDFLNDLLKGERVITDLTFLNNEQLPEWEDARALIYDIHCTTDTGEKIIVEMQISLRPISGNAPCFTCRMLLPVRGREVTGCSTSRLYMVCSS